MRTPVLTWRVFWWSFRGQLVPMGLMALGLAAFQYLIASVFPSIGGSEGVTALFETLPKPVRALIQAQDGGSGVFGLDGFLAMGYNHPVWASVASAFAIATGAPAVAGEVDRGTILLLLSRPLSRRQMLVGKAAVIVVGLAVVIGGGFLGTALAGATIDLGAPIKLSRFGLVAVNAYALFLAVGACALLLSTLMSYGGQAVGLATGLTVSSFFLRFLADLWDKVEPLSPLSVFHYYNPQTIVSSGEMPWRDVAVLLGVAALCLLAATVAFERRDLAR